MKYKTTRKAIVNGSVNVKCTGYRNMPGSRLEGIREYEEKARAIINDWETYKGNYEAKKEAVEKLLQEFCLKNGGCL